MTVDGLLLVTHIAAGFTALFVAPGAMIASKGGAWHRRWGKIYYWAMAAVCATALGLVFFRPNIFLTMVAVFSFYMCYIGYRVLNMKRPDIRESDRPKPWDWLFVGLAFAASVVLVVFGLLTLNAGTEQTGITPIVIGGLGVFVTGSDLRWFINPPTDRNAWWFRHMTGFLGGYIGTVSAFSVVNLTFLPEIVRWIWPTVVGSVMISVWVSRYARKFAERRDRRTSRSERQSVGV